MEPDSIKAPDAVETHSTKVCIAIWMLMLSKERLPRFMLEIHEQPRDTLAGTIINGVLH